MKSSGLSVKLRAMPPLQTFIESTRWFGENFAFNMGFIPSDKLDWKPAPTAKSAMEITSHQVFGMRAMQAALSGEGLAGFAQAEPRFSTLEDAQKGIREATQKYAAFLESLSPADLEGEIELPFGTFPRAIAVTMEAQDLIHHHGQIAYIQTLLGDCEDHYIPLS